LRSGRARLEHPLHLIRRGLDPLLSLCASKNDNDADEKTGAGGAYIDERGNLGFVSLSRRRAVLLGEILNIRDTVLIEEGLGAIIATNLQSMTIKTGARLQATKSGTHLHRRHLLHAPRIHRN